MRSGPNRHMSKFSYPCHLRDHCKNCVPILHFSVVYDQNYTLAFSIAQSTQSIFHYCLFLLQNPPRCNYKIYFVVLHIKQISIASNGVVALNGNSPYKLPATTGGLTSNKYNYHYYDNRHRLDVLFYPPILLYQVL